VGLIHHLIVYKIYLLEVIDEYLELNHYCKNLCETPCTMLVVKLLAFVHNFEPTHCPNQRLSMQITCKNIFEV
jgi:hypothetical protein